MRKLAISLLFSAVACGADRDAVSYVNPLIGTRESAIGYGGTMPFVSPPFAMTNWTPQTRQNKISITSYNYDDSTISGFIGTHQPAIWMGDYGYLTLMPQVGVLRTAPDGRKLAYLHSSETASPDYYAVSLGAREETAIRVEMTASERCAMLRFQFPKICMTIASDLLHQHIQTLVDDNAQWQMLIADDILWELAYAPSLGHPAKLSGREEAVRHATWFVGAVENFRFSTSRCMS
jgi:putative alpha-1,2-mannosidase